MAELQAAFDVGTMGLAKDDDSKIRDSDPILTSDVSVFRADDVPVYIEFVITNCGAFGPVPGYDFTHPDYFDIANLNRGGELAFFGDIGFIRQVKSLPQNALGVPILGLSYPARPGIVVPINASAVTLLHEWGHTQGAEHRGHANNPASDNESEELTTDKALMRRNGNEFFINRFEGALFDSPPPYKTVN